MNTKRSLLTSCLALLLCFAMLLGTTFAWFTDTVTSSGNKIHSGSLKLDLLVLKEGSTDNWFSIKNTSEPIFSYENWEPGYTDVTILKVENLGNLSLKWVAKLASENPLSELSEVIDVYVLPGATEYPTDRTTLDGWNKTGTLADFINSISTTTYGYLDGGASATLGIAFKMQEDAGNEYQNLTLGEFDIRIVATQADAEYDDFGNDYDADAEYPAGSGTFSASTDVDITNINYGALRNPVTIGEADGINANIPADVKIEEGATNLKLTVKPVDSDNNFSLGEGESAVSLDVHIDGIAADNEKPMTVNLGAILPAGLTETEVNLVHIENGVPVNMTRVNSAADFSHHNQYTYDPATGEVSIYVKSFSVFAAMKRNASKWDGSSATTSWYTANTSAKEFLLTSASDLAGFRDLVDSGTTFAGKTVKLDVDVDLGDKLFDPIGFDYANKGGKVFKGTFDGQHHTIYGLYQNGWELDPDKTNYSTYAYSTAGAGLFASIQDATIKNLAISGAEIVFECVDMGIVVGYAQGTCHFENIVVTDSNIANYNRYTGGVVGEVSFGPFGTDTTKGYSHTFKNITVDSSVKVSGLWGSFGCGMGGVIGGKWGDATVKMENVVSAAEMDVYNDVTSAYQWYAFRGCGMLIGHTEEPYADGKHSGNATASFLTCENVNVYYGDWVNYTYYQFANQTDAEGKELWYSNYPWVRVEEGEYCDAYSNIRYGIPLVNGVKVTELSKEDFNKAVTSTANIVFDQLYGADVGMYGTASHPGVNVSYSLPKIFYIENNVDWDNLKLYYEYNNREDTWTTVAEGVELVEFAGAYRIDLPVGASKFYITADGNKKSKDFIVSQLEHRKVYLLHEHELDANGDCECGYDNLFAGKVFVPTVNSDALVLEEDWFTSGRYETLTDGFRKQEFDGRFSTVMDNKTAYVDATINLDGVYTLETMRFYTYDTRTLTEAYKKALLGKDLLVQAYCNGVWTDIINCADNAAISSHLVIEDGRNNDYLEFDLNSVTGASAIRILISNAAHEHGITFQEIECTGSQTSATGPATIPAAPVYVPTDSTYITHRVFIPTAAAKEMVLNANWWNGGDYKALTDRVKDQEQAGRFATTMSKDAFIDATLDLECPYLIQQIWFRPYVKDGVVPSDNYGDGITIEYLDANDEIVDSVIYTYDEVQKQMVNSKYFTVKPNVFAQKVRIYIKAKSSQGITLQEIEMKGKALENVALGKVPSSTTASNVYSAQYGYQCMTDGIIHSETSGRYSSAGSSKTVQATINLGADYTLSELKFLLYRYDDKGLGHFGKSIKIEVYYNNAWTTVVNTDLSDSMVVDNGARDWLTLNLGGVTASQVRFTISNPTSGYTTFHEVECMGCSK